MPMFFIEQTCGGISGGTRILNVGREKLEPIDRGNCETNLDSNTTYFEHSTCHVHCLEAL